MKFEKSAGAVVYHNNKFLLLHYESGHWGFVKGHLESDESEGQAMARELKEETGITNFKIIEGFREETGYYFKRGGETISKKVVYFLIESLTSDVRLSYEHVGYEWLDYDEAINRLTFDNDKRVLRIAKSLLH